MEAWIVDLRQQAVTVYRDPEARRYRTVQVARRRDQLAPVAVPDRTVAVDDILG